jgi:hypothetical protein
MRRSLLPTSAKETTEERARLNDFESEYYVSHRKAVVPIARLFLRNDALHSSRFITPLKPSF